MSMQWRVVWQCHSLARSECALVHLDLCLNLHDKYASFFKGGALGYDEETLHKYYDFVQRHWNVLVQENKCGYLNSFHWDMPQMHLSVSQEHSLRLRGKSLVLLCDCYVILTELIKERWFV